MNTLKMVESDALVGAAWDVLPPARKMGAAQGG
jgi:hypothetical protein